MYTYNHVQVSKKTLQEKCKLVSKTAVCRNSEKQTGSVWMRLD